MTAASIRLSSRLLRFLASACVLLAFAMPAACRTHLTPTIAHVSGRDVEVVEGRPGDSESRSGVGGLST